MNPTLVFVDGRPKVDPPKGRALKLSCLLILAALAILTAWSVGNAQGPVVTEIRIAGNQRVEDDAIRVHINAHPGEPLNAQQINQDIKSIYRMGFFDQVNAEVSHEAKGVVLTYRVKERPLITEVKLEGFKKIKSKDEKVQQAIKVRAHSILDPEQVNETIKALKTVYVDKTYLDANVTFHTILKPDNTAVAVFHVDEGPAVRITKVQITGNKAFSSGELRSLMETGPHNILSFLTGRGALDRKKLEDDVERITAYYYDHGYLNAHVAEPEIKRTGGSITITIEIDEGQPYRVDKVTIRGDLKVPEKELLAKLKLKHGDIFRGSTMQHDVLTLSDFYSDRGYAFVNVDPRTAINAPDRQIDITYQVTPGQEVLVDRIKITGNTKTSDKVIRRELQIQEQEPYSAAKIRESQVRLKRLGIFEEARISTDQGRAPDRINLNVAVREGQTGSFQMAGGFSTSSSVFGNFRLGENNLFGGGQSVSLDAAVGFLFQNFTLSYTEPYFLDMPLNAGIDLFDWTLHLQNFDRSSAGFAIRTLYPLAELGLRNIGPFSLKDVSVGLNYRFESVGITGINTLTTYDIRRYKGYSRTSEVILALRRFTVNNPIDPRSGSVQSLNVQFAGLGGENKFIKGLFHSRFFFSFIDSPTWGNWVYAIGGDFGIGTDLVSGSAGELPLFERFFPGGIDSVRGYEFYSLGPRVLIRNQLGEPVSYQNVGGSKELLLNNEITFPILESLGVRGMLFLDSGNSFRLSQSMALDQLQAAAGPGLFWKSPFGPVRVAIGVPINPRPGDQSVDFIFGAGSNL